MMRPLLIAPSLLACDFGRIAEEIRAVEQAGADWLHLDVMDGHFVPNISFGPVVISAARRSTKLPLDVQLMIEHPERYADAFIEAGSDHLTVHVEAAGLREPQAMRQFLQDMRQRGVRAGLSLRPGTPAQAMQPYLDEVDQLLVMTVEPGFGGQAFLPEMLGKIQQLRAWFPGDIVVDGGINAETARHVWQAGANILVTGTYVFRAVDYRVPIAALRKAESS